MRRSDSGAFIRILLSPSSQIACVAACFMFQSLECAFHVLERIFHIVEHAFHNVERRMYPGFVKKNGGPDGKTDGRKRKKSGALAAAAPDCSHERRVMLRAHCCFL